MIVLTLCLVLTVRGSDSSVPVNVLQFSKVADHATGESFAKLGPAPSATAVESVSVCLDVKLDYRVKMRFFESLNNGQRIVAASVEKTADYGFLQIKERYCSTIELYRIVSKYNKA